MWRERTRSRSRSASFARVWTRPRSTSPSAESLVVSGRHGRRAEWLVRRYSRGNVRKFGHYSLSTGSGGANPPRVETKMLRRARLEWMRADVAETDPGDCDRRRAVSADGQRAPSTCEGSCERGAGRSGAPGAGGERRACSSRRCPLPATAGVSSRGRTASRRGHGSRSAGWGYRGCCSAACRLDPRVSGHVSDDPNGSGCLLEPPFQRGFAVSNPRGSGGYVWKRPS